MARCRYRWMQVKIDARIDVIRREVIGVRFLDELQDVAIRIGFHQAVGARILDRRSNRLATPNRSGRKTSSLP